MTSARRSPLALPRGHFANAGCQFEALPCCAAALLVVLSQTAHADRLAAMQQILGNRDSSPLPPGRTVGGVLRVIALQRGTGMARIPPRVHLVALPW